MRVAIVTGASRGIGRATALRLGREGHAVAVAYRHEEERARETCAALAALGAEALPVCADLEDGSRIDALFDQVAERWGRVDVMVANAAATAFRDLLETRPHHVRRTFSISVDGFLRCAQRAVALMEGGGAIVAVSGFDALRALPGHAVLGAAKSALETLVRYLAVELAPRDVRVNAVSPGYVATDSARTYAGEDYETREREWIAATPLRRLASPDEIAQVIWFLCSQESSFVTGQTLVADGGLTLR